jgi:GT2 family glycosyltransferase
MINSLRGLIHLVQNWFFALRRYVPAPLQTLLRPVHRRWWLWNSERALQKALQDAHTLKATGEHLSVTPPAARIRGKALIVIVSYNSADYLKLCLNSLLLNTSTVNHQIVVVDNKSGPEVTHYLQEMERLHSNIRVIYNEANLGFARANNQGLTDNHDCDYMVLLNNDTLVTPGWLSGLLSHLEQDRQLGMVGPVTNWASNEAKISVDYTSLGDMYSFARRYTQAHTGQLEEVPMLAMFCVAMRRAVFEQIGPLDEGYGLGMFEDDDYALRVRQHGYNLAVAHDVFVHHWGWVSFGRMPQKEYDRLFSANKARFESKWARAWQRPRFQVR